MQAANTLKKNPGYEAEHTSTSQTTQRMLIVTRTDRKLHTDQSNWLYTFFTLHCDERDQECKFNGA